MIGLIKDRLAAKVQTSDAKCILDVRVQDFSIHVLEASNQSLVLVDFWAPWCGPCQQLTPLLERMVTEHPGLVRLAKVNADEEPQLTAYLRVQSLPTVYAFAKGQPIDAFVGLLPAEKLKEFIKNALAKANLAPQENDLLKLCEQADHAFYQKDPLHVSSLYESILRQDPTNHKALVGLARSYLMLGQREKAQRIDAQLSPEHTPPSEGQSLAAHFDLLSSLEDSSSYPSSFSKVLKLCLEADFEKAVDHLLEMVKNSESQDAEIAKALLLKIFTVLGYQHILSIEARRRLSAMLFA